MADLIKLDQRAVAASVAIVDQVDVNSLDSRTPCSEWSLRQLLEHMIVQHDGFATAATGARTEIEDWRPRAVADPIAGYVAAAERVTAAFLAPGVLDQEFFLPEVSSRRTFRGSVAIGFHFIDYVVHGWDVAKAIGAPANYDADLVEAAVPYARIVPDDASRRQPGAAFASALDPYADASTLDQIVAYLGRDPRWTAERTTTS